MTDPIGGLDPTRTALGTWSGGQFMHFGEPLDDARFEALIAPDSEIRTVVTADVYGCGEADLALGRALAARLAPACRKIPTPRELFDMPDAPAILATPDKPAAAPAPITRHDICLVGAVGHDFYTGERDGPKGFPRFTDPRLRGPDQYASYLRMATERSLERCGVDSFDLLLLHNPDRTGYTSEAVWEGMQALRDAGLTRLIGVAPGPANGFTLDLIDCFERFGEMIDWAMVILNPLEPWPGELCLDAAAGHDVKVITRVVDYGGLFYGDLLPGADLGRQDHRSFRPEGWIEAGVQRMDAMRPIAERAGLTMIQLACQWNLAHAAVRTVVPTLVQERGPGALSVERKRAELAALPLEQRLTPAEIEEIRRLGDNTGSMTLKGANPSFEGDERPDGWEMSERLEQVARRWRIEPARDLARA